MTSFKTMLALGAVLAGGTPLLAQATTSSTATTTPNAAPTAANVAVGAKVSDTAGAPVGTIDAVTAGVATLNTGTVKANIPVASFAAGANGGLVIAITKANLEQQASSAQAQAAAELATGAKVSDAQGAPVGTIESTDGAFATVATANSKARLPKTAFAKGPDGFVIGMTAAQLDAAAKAAATPK